MKITSYRDLIVWQKAMALVLAIYKMTEKFPKSEIYGLTSQLRRSAISIPSNIAEGKARSTKKDYRHFLINAFASGAELETQLLLSKKLFFKDEIEYSAVDGLLEEVMKMLNSLIQKLKSNIQESNT